MIVELVGKKKDAYTHPVVQWAKEQRGRILCPNCGKLRQDLFPQPVDVPLIQLYKGTSYSIVFRGGVAVIHQRLLDFLRPHLPEHSLGRCFWRDGSLLPDYHSIYFRDYIFFRAGRESPRYEYYECEICGLSGASSDEPYVLRSELPDATVFQDAIHCLYLSASLARVFPWREFRDLEPFTFPVRDEPLPDDPLPVGWRPAFKGQAWLTARTNSLPESVREPEPDRYAELKAMTLDLPRLEDDSAKSCPVPMRKIMSYLRLEGVDRRIKARDLQFLRTARVGDRDCWIWRFEEQVCADAYVTVWRGPDGALCVGYGGNSHGLTPEQYIYGEHHKYF